MPTGTRVHNCVEKLKQEGETGGSPYAICQSATGQSFATGKPLKKSLDPQEARRVLESKIPLLVQIARDSQWGILYDAISDIFSDLGYSRYDAEARHIRNSAEGMVRQYGQQSELTWRDFFDPYYGHFSNVLIDISHNHQRRGTKGLTAKTKSFNRGQAEQTFRQKLPLLIELAKDGAWDPFHDVWTDILHDIGDPYIGDVVDDVHSIRRSVESGNNPETVIQIATRLVLRDAERYWRENPQGHRTKGLTANDARQIIQAKEPLLIQIAEAGAWYALQDQLEDLISELGLDGFCNPKNGTNLIRAELERYRVTATQALRRYSEYLEICTEQYGTKSLKVKTKNMQYNFRTALAMVQDRQLDILHDYLTECAEDRGVENAASLVDYHMRMIREVMREVPESEWPNWSATRGYIGTVIRNELADFEHTLDYRGTKSFKVKTKAMSKADAITDIADMLDMDPPTGLVHLMRSKYPQPWSDRLEATVDLLANAVIAGNFPAAQSALYTCESYFGMEGSYFFNEAHEQLRKIMGW